MTGAVCFEQKTTICIAKFGDLGDNGDRGSKYVVENAIFGAIFGIANSDLLIHNTTFMGLLPKPKLYTKFEVASFNGCRNKQGVPNFYTLL